MTEKKLFNELTKRKIKFVLIGGTALLKYGSQRATLDTDIVVKAIDLDEVIKIMYKLGYKIITNVEDDYSIVFAKTFKEAISSINSNNIGFAKFISDFSEVDVLYEISVPFMRLYQNSIEEKFEDIIIKIASLEHLKILKEVSLKNREDAEKKSIDKIDLDFINKKLNSNTD